MQWFFNLSSEKFYSCACHYEQKPYPTFQSTSSSKLESTSFIKMCSFIQTKFSTIYEPIKIQLFDKYAVLHEKRIWLLLDSRDSTTGGYFSFR